MILGIIIGLAVGFVAGILVGRKNRKGVESILDKSKEVAHKAKG